MFIITKTKNIPIYFCQISLRPFQISIYKTLTSFSHHFCSLINLSFLIHYPIFFLFQLRIIMIKLGFFRPNLLLFLFQHFLFQNKFFLFFFQFFLSSSQSISIPVYFCFRLFNSSSFKLSLFKKSLNTSLFFPQSTIFKS